MPKIIPVMERIARRTIEAPCLTKGLHPTCWVWQGAKINGYGNIATTPRGDTRCVHLAAYQVLVGPVPDGLKLIHLCAVRACWNPAHLKPGTQAEIAAYYDIARINGLRTDTKTHCVNGHEFTPENSGRDCQGRRFCRICQQQNGKRWHKEWIAKVPNPPRTKDSREAEAAQIRHLRAQGKTFKQIAIQLGLAQSTVFERVKVNS